MIKKYFSLLLLSALVIIACESITESVEASSSAKYSLKCSIRKGEYNNFLGVIIINNETGGIIDEFETSLNTTDWREEKSVKDLVGDDYEIKYQFSSSRHWIVVFNNETGVINDHYFVDDFPRKSL